MAVLSYANFKTSLQAGDLILITTLLSNDRIGTTDPVEATTFQSALERFHQVDTEILQKYSYSKERVSGVLWHIFEGRIDPVVVKYVADLAEEGRVAV